MSRILRQYQEQKHSFQSQNAYVILRPVYTLVIFEVSPPTSDEQLGILAVVSQKFPNDEIRQIPGCSNCQSLFQSQIPGCSNYQNLFQSLSESKDQSSRLGIPSCSIFSGHEIWIKVCLGHEWQSLDSRSIARSILEVTSFIGSCIWILCEISHIYIQ